MPASKVAISREHLGTRAGHAIQEQTQKVASALANIGLQPGVLVTGIVVSVGPVITVIHGLGRIPRGWFAVRRYGYISGNIGEIEAGGPTDTVLTIGAVGAYTCDLWVF